MPVATLASSVRFEMSSFAKMWLRSVLTVLRLIGEGLIYRALLRRRGIELISYQEPNPEGRSPGFWATQMAWPGPAGASSSTWATGTGRSHERARAFEEDRFATTRPLLLGRTMLDCRGRPSADSRLAGQDSVVCWRKRKGPRSSTTG